MSARTPADICLLCRSTPAIKTNSHILPRFISTGFLRQEGRGNRGYQLGEERRRVIQDSPKEDYILCDSCEAYFSVIEGISADTFKYWREKLQQGEFSEEPIGDNLRVVTCQSAHPGAVRLLIYSMFWRASISNHGVFQGYNLKHAFEENLRQILLSYKCQNRGELIQVLEQTPIPLFPISVVTVQNLIDESAAVLAAINSENPYSLNVDKFGFLLFEQLDDVKGFVREFSNINGADCKFMVLSEELWNSVMVTQALQIVAVQERQIKKNEK